jgi:hypothetical protein
LNLIEGEEREKVEDQRRCGEKQLLYALQHNLTDDLPQIAGPPYAGALECLLTVECQADALPTGEGRGRKQS